MGLLPLLAVLMLVLVGCGGGSQTSYTPTLLPIATFTPALPMATPTVTPTPSPTPMPTQVPPTPTPTSIPTPTATATLLPVRRQLEWPIDVGTSHFGALGNKLEGFSGAWIRPLPGRFIGG